MASEGKSSGFGPQPGDRKSPPLEGGVVKNVVSNSDLKTVVRKPNV